MCFFGASELSATGKTTGDELTIQAIGGFVRAATRLTSGIGKSLKMRVPSLERVPKKRRCISHGSPCIIYHER